MRDQSPVLPPLSAISCCWLVQEKIELVEFTEKHRFTTALAIEQSKHVLVLFDGLGNKILASTRQPGSISVDMDKSGGKIPVNILWSAINLVHAPVAEWPQTNRRWRTIGADGQRILRHNSDTWARAWLGESEHGMTNAFIKFPSRNITLKVNGVEKRAL